MMTERASSNPGTTSWAGRRGTILMIGIAAAVEFAGIVAVVVQKLWS